MDRLGARGSTAGASEARRSPIHLCIGLKIGVGDGPYVDRLQDGAVLMRSTKSISWKREFAVSARCAARGVHNECALGLAFCWRLRRVG